ncbi:MAG: aspartate aminotransferase family protein [Nitrospinota bacterium]
MSVTVKRGKEKKTSSVKPSIRVDDRHMFLTYSRHPVTLVKGKGFYVWDSNGKKYIDFVAGLGVNNLGHCHPEVVSAVKKQSSLLLHTSNLYFNKNQADLARKLTSGSFADRVFFCNSGAEANEAAIKLVRKNSLDKYGKGRFEIITMEGSFHGRTMGALSATGQAKIRNGFEPLVPGFKFVPLNKIELLAKAVTSKTCAIFIEPVQGEGGVNVSNADYLREVRELAYEKDIALVFDEVQCGVGRTGKLFAYDFFDVKPDAMTISRGLGGGLPIGAMLAREDISKAFEPGSHGTTFGGGPLVSAAALATLKSMDRTVLSNCTAVGKFFLRKLKKLKTAHPVIKSVRGIGLMIGVELEIPGKEIVSKLLEAGFLVNCTMGNVLRFLPPLTIGRQEVEALVVALDKVLCKVEESSAGE